MSESTTDQAVRAFVALELSDEARAFCAVAMARARSALGADSRAVRWVDPEGIHLTLKFLGSVPTEPISNIVDSLTRELAGQEPFELAAGGLGVFPNPRAPRVVWLELLGNLTALRSAQERVEVALAPLGFPPEKRPFQPHLTLGRVRETATREQLALIGRLPTDWPANPSSPFPVASISLMQSHLGPNDAHYTRLAAIPLRGERHRGDTEGARREG